VPVESGDVRDVRCYVCLDEGCEWCPAVDAVEEEFDVHATREDPPR